MVSVEKPCIGFRYSKNLTETTLKKDKIHRRTPAKSKTPKKSLRKPTNNVNKENQPGVNEFMMTESSQIFYNHTLTREFINNQKRINSIPLLHNTYDYLVDGFVEDPKDLNEYHDKRKYKMNIKQDYTKGEIEKFKASDAYKESIDMSQLSSQELMGYHRKLVKKTNIDCAAHFKNQSSKICEFGLTTGKYG